MNGVEMWVIVICRGDEVCMIFLLEAFLSFLLLPPFSFLTAFFFFVYQLPIHYRLA